MFFKDNKDRLISLLINFHHHYDSERNPTEPPIINDAANAYIEHSIKEEEFYEQMTRDANKILADNQALLKLIRKSKGRRFFKHLLALIECSEAQWDIPMTIVETPEGDYQKQNEFGRNIKGIWVSQKCFEDSCSGTVCVEIYPGQYLRFYFCT